MSKDLKQGFSLWQFRMGKKKIGEGKQEVYFSVKGLAVWRMSRNQFAHPLNPKSVGFIPILTKMYILSCKKNHCYRGLVLGRMASFISKFCHWFKSDGYFTDWIYGLERVYACSRDQNYIFVRLTYCQFFLLYSLVTQQFLFSNFNHFYSFM